MAQAAFFDQTSWTTVVQARAGEESLRQAALERLLTRYRRPMQMEIRSRARCSDGEAEELTHRFIHNCLRRDFLKYIDPQKGRFRSFIKACIVNFLRDVHREKAGQPVQISLEQTDEEGQQLFDPPAETLQPEIAADIHWAHQVVALSLEQLQQECVAARRGALFTTLRPYLHEDKDRDPQGYATAAAALGIKEGALRTAIHRMRQRLAEIIEQEIKETVTRAEDWRDELRYFLDLLGKGTS